MKKKIIAILFMLVLILIFTLAACDTSTTGTPSALQNYFADIEATDIWR